MLVVLDGVLGDNNTNLEEVTSDPFNTSYAQQHLENEEDSADDSDEEIQTKKDNVPEIGNQKRKFIINLHQKRKVVRSQTQALSQLSGSIWFSWLILSQTPQYSVGV